MSTIRLKDEEIKAICQVFESIFPPGDKLWIFGSRVDPLKKGGDIDLYIETKGQDAKELIERKSRFLSELKQQIGDQRIDLIIKFKDHELEIYQTAHEEGKRLV